MTIYYVNSKYGSDANSGTSTLKPWKSISHVNAQQFNPGDQILLKRGDVYGTGLYIDSSGTATAPIKIGTYGAGANPRFDGSEELVRGKWVETFPGSGVWRTPVAARGGEDPGRIRFNGVNGEIESSGVSVLKTPGDWSWDAGFLSIYSKTHPSVAFKSIALQVDNRMIEVHAKYVVIDSIDVTMARYGFNIGAQDVTIENSNAYDNTMNGFTLSRSTRVSINGGSSFGNGRTGEGNSTLHTGHGVLITNGSNDNLVQGMKLYSNAEDGVQFGPSTMNGNVIRNNEIYRNCEDGADIKGWGNQSFIGNIIYGNAELGININSQGTMRLERNYVSSNDAQAVETGKGGAVISYENTYVGENSSVVSLWSPLRSTFVRDTFIDGGLGSKKSIDISAGSGHVFEDSTFVMRNPGTVMRVNASADNVTVKNSSFFSEEAILLRFDEGKRVTTDYNRFYREDGNSTWFMIDGTTSRKSYGSTDVLTFGAHSTAARPVTAGEGTDALVGDGGANRLDGKGGNDVLLGRAGNDFLKGGAGTDTMFGDAGGDVFVFSAALGASNVDRIGDFNTTDDSIYIDNEIFKGTGNGTASTPLALNHDMFTTGSRALDVEDRIIFNRTSGHLYYDSDGTGPAKPILFAVAVENARLTASDIFVI